MPHGRAFARLVQQTQTQGDAKDPANLAAIKSLAQGRMRTARRLKISRFRDIKKLHPDSGNLPQVVQNGLQDGRGTHPLGKGLTDHF
jgi:hypothetical protein